MTLQILSTTRKLGLMTLEKKQSLPKRVTTSMELLLVTLFGNDFFFSNVIRPNLRVVLKIFKVIYLNESTHKLGLMTLEKKQSLPKRVTTIMALLLWNSTHLSKCRHAKCYFRLLIETRQTTSRAIPDLFI